MFSNLFFNKTNRKKIKQLEKRVFELERKLNSAQLITNMNLLRLKNDYFVTDQVIASQSPYIDISAYKAYEIYLSDENQYFIIDVDDNEYVRPIELNNSVNIPLNELEKNLDKIPSKLVPLFIISQKGINSIHACEVLSKSGYYNCYNISGGYEKWPKMKVHGLNQKLD